MVALVSSPDKAAGGDHKSGVHRGCGDHSGSDLLKISHILPQSFRFGPPLKLG